MSRRTLERIYASRKTALRGAQRAVEPGWEAGEPIPTEGGWKAVLVAEKPVPVAPVVPDARKVILISTWGRHKRPAVVALCAEYIGDGVYAVGSLDSAEEIMLRKTKRGVVQVRGRSEHWFENGNPKPIIGFVLGWIDVLDTEYVNAISY